MRTRLSRAVRAGATGLAVTALLGCSQFSGLKAKMALKDANAAHRFKYKLSDRVRSKRGDGVVVFGASSQQNRITQYVVKRDDGTVFAELEEELTKLD